MATRILLADDSITIQKVVELTFSEGDFEVFSVSNGQQALEKIPEWTPDIALLDVIMPEKSGYEVCHEIKQDPKFRDLPVLLLTGTFEPFDPERAKKSGANGHITKPFESRTLVAKVEELLASKAASPAAIAEKEKESGREALDTNIELTTKGGEKEETPDWVADDFPQGLPNAAEIEKDFGKEMAPDQPTVGVKVDDDLLASGSETGLETPVEEIPSNIPGSTKTLPPQSEFGKTMRIDLSTGFSSNLKTGPGREEAPGQDLPGGSKGGNPPESWGPPSLEIEEPEPRESSPAAFIDSSSISSGGSPDSQVSEGSEKPVDGGLVLSQESIDTLAKRVVEKLSDQIVREIAWEVVPDLAETLIRKRIQELEEKIGDQ